MNDVDSFGRIMEDGKQANGRARFSGSRLCVKRHREKERERMRGKKTSKREGE